MELRAQRGIFGYGLAAMLLITSTHAHAGEKKYGPGASDTEIKIGNTAAYSGPGSAYGAIAKAEAAYFKMINERGGINGRKINFISYDDGYSPPKTVEQTRKLVEGDEVLLMFSMIGTPTSAAAQTYLNAKHVPQLFTASGAARFDDPKAAPWSMGWSPNYVAEGRVYAQYILKNFPGSKIGILYQNDDIGRDYRKGIREALGDNAASMIVAEVSHETSEPTADSQVYKIKAANPDIFMALTTTKFTAQIIRKIASLGWKPVRFISSSAAGITNVLQPAGLDNSKDVLSSHYMKDPNDPQWKDDAGMNEFRQFMQEHYPDGDKTDLSNAYGYGSATALVKVLEQCGDDLTRENVMKQAEALDLSIGVYLPGSRLKTSSTDHAPLEQIRLMKFTGETWEFFGELIDGHKDR
ncbi:ABC transporter substrate-binding protein [Bradyrhizobium iriomotense]|uniref:ABC transporter substrate-binding protein n=1 Tax=Bradyrhizobium iriomotense TaxID=441950 RepID=UPI001B89FB1A|nr:ABC transporter substrate-binding protein [Bradyrhizobium iriomotense]MBR0781905.1 ABC transporter substrate-binding protein [Bradyrhizobium iriomotense]